MKIRILAAAQKDLVHGFRFYESQGEGLGTYFLDALFSDIDSLLLYAGIHGMVAGGYYRMLAKRFPFAIYYRINNSDILVYAVLDCRQNPAWTRKRIGATNP